MHALRKQRLILILLLITGVGLAAVLTLFALRENINHYFSPAQMANGQAPVGKKIRGGGLVVLNSVIREPNSLVVRFQITDREGTIAVIYNGILPDLFKEGQGVVALGMLNEKKEFIAEEILAKHDETYMPPEVQKAIDNAHHDKSSPRQDYGS